MIMQKTFIGLFVILLVGCKSGVQPDLLDLPENTLTERLPDSAKTNLTGLVSDYAPTSTWAMTLLVP